MKGNICSASGTQIRDLMLAGVIPEVAGDDSEAK